MAVENISRSISSKVWDRAGIKLVNPGAAVRHAPAVGHIADFATRTERRLATDALGNRLSYKKRLPGKGTTTDCNHEEETQNTNIHMTIKEMLLSKALTCMNFFQYKQKWLFYHGDGYPWLYCCMDNLSISHRSLYAPTYSF